MKHKHLVKHLAQHLMAHMLRTGAGAQPHMQPLVEKVQAGEVNASHVVRELWGRLPYETKDAFRNRAEDILEVGRNLMAEQAVAEKDSKVANDEGDWPSASSKPPPRFM